MIAVMTKTLAALLCLTAIAQAATAQTFAVGTARAERGQTATGFLEVPAGVDSGTSIPVVVVQGARPGPVTARSGSCPAGARGPGGLPTPACSGTGAGIADGPHPERRHGHDQHLR